MLTNAPVSPSLPVVDLERAEKFYEGKLGLRVIFEDPSPGAMLEAGEGTTIYIYQRAATKADHTVAGFRVKDIEAAVRELKANDIALEEVNIPGGKTVDGITTMTTPAGDFKGVWFKDTEGNILSISNM